MPADDKKAKPNGAAGATGAAVVTCPDCKKKFKPKTDVRGKKIKCPFCTHPFVVPAAKSEGIKSGEPKASKEKAGATVPVSEPAASGPVDEYDADPNPYGVKSVDLVPRCPNCTQEMGEHDIICLACGYNTMTRQWGKTEKTVGIGFVQHLVYLLPALGSLAFVLFSIIFLVYYCVVSPYHVDGVAVLHYSDHESMRMWTTVIFLAWCWAAGIFCFKKFIENPKPKEKVLD